MKSSYLTLLLVFGLQGCRLISNVEFSASGDAIPKNPDFSFEGQSNCEICPIEVPFVYEWTGESEQNSPEVQNRLSRGQVLCFIGLSDGRFYVGWVTEDTFASSQNLNAFLAKEGVSYFQCRKDKNVLFVEVFAVGSGFFGSYEVEEYLIEGNELIRSPLPGRILRNEYKSKQLKIIQD